MYTFVLKSRSHGILKVEQKQRKILILDDFWGPSHEKVLGRLEGFLEDPEDPAGTHLPKWLESRAVLVSASGMPWSPRTGPFSFSIFSTFKENFFLLFPKNFFCGIYFKGRMGTSPVVTRRENSYGRLCTYLKKA